MTWRKHTSITINQVGIRNSRALSFLVCQISRMLITIESCTCIRRPDMTDYKRERVCVFVFLHLPQVGGRVSIKIEILSMTMTFRDIRAPTPKLQQLVFGAGSQRQSALYPSSKPQDHQNVKHQLISPFVTDLLFSKLDSISLRPFPESSIIQFSHHLFSNVATFSHCIAVELSTPINQPEVR